MQKPVWKFDSQNKIWWWTFGEPWKETSFTIYKEGGVYYLEKNHIIISGFRKLKTAKAVANLIVNG